MYAVDHKTQELVAQAKDGNEAALNQLYTVYAERVRWMVRLRMGRELRSKLESMDLVQNTLIHALRDLGKFTYRGRLIIGNRDAAFDIVLCSKTTADTHDSGRPIVTDTVTDLFDEGDVISHQRLPENGFLTVPA